MQTRQWQKTLTIEVQISIETELNFNTYTAVDINFNKNIQQMKFLDVFLFEVTWTIKQIQHLPHYTNVWRNRILSQLLMLLFRIHIKRRWATASGHSPIQMTYLNIRKHTTLCKQTAKIRRDFYRTRHVVLCEFNSSES